MGILERSAHQDIKPITRSQYGTPQLATETRPDYLFIGPWNLVDEIVGQTSYIREWGAQWVGPISDTKILS
jgi:C-methyltransferase C-terminal domain